MIDPEDMKPIINAEKFFSFATGNLLALCTG